LYPRVYLSGGGDYWQIVSIIVGIETLHNIEQKKKFLPMHHMQQLGKFLCTSSLNTRT